MEIRWEFQIGYYTLPQMTHWTKKVQFLFIGPISKNFFFDLEIRWEFQIRYCTFPQMTNWTTKVQFPCLWTDLYNFSLNIKYDGDSKYDIKVYLK